MVDIVFSGFAFSGGVIELHLAVLMALFARLFKTLQSLRRASSL